MDMVYLYSYNFVDGVNFVCSFCRDDYESMILSLSASELEDFFTRYFVSDVVL